MPADLSDCSDQSDRSDLCDKIVKHCNNPDVWGDCSAYFFMITAAGEVERRDEVYFILLSPC